MKICVFGAGAIGAHLAARLDAGGAKVSVVVRGAHLAAIKANGIEVHAPDRTWTCRVAASDDPRELGRQDVVIVSVKGPSLSSVAAAIPPLLGPDTPVIFVMNGLPWWYFQGSGAAIRSRLPAFDFGESAWRGLSPEQVIGGVIFSGSEVVKPGVVHVDSSGDRLMLGRPDDRPSAIANEVSAILSAGGVKGQVTDRIRHVIWEKLLRNLTTGPFSVLTAATPREIFVNDTLTATSKRVVAEAAAVAAAVGIDLGPDVEPLVESNRIVSHRPSILQDLLLGRPMEVSTLYGRPLLLAHATKVPAPTLEILVALVEARARAAGLYSE